MLTVGDLKKLIEKLEVPDTAIICIPWEAQKTSSIPIQVNAVLFSKAENSYGKEDLLTFVISPEYPAKDVSVEVLTGRNQWGKFFL